MSERQNKPLRAAIYCRLSREDREDRGDGESESIRNQRAMLTGYAAAQGWQVVKVYCDEDYSGIDRSRPAFNEMLQAARAGQLDLILAKTQSRFTRDMELVERYLHDWFARWGVRFVTLVDRVDTGEPSGKKARQITGLVNEWYLEELSENVRAVLANKRARGQYLAAHALYGYQKDPANKNHLIPDPEAAAIVRQIFALYLAGEGTGRIAARLNGAGVAAPTAYRQARSGEGGPAPLWGKATLGQMLHNRTYAGDLTQGRQQRISYKSGRMRRLPQESWTVVAGTHEPLIDPETFELVQRLLARRSRGGGGGRVHPLAGRVRCGVCGGPLTLTGGRGGAYLRCGTHRRSPERCCPNYIRLGDLEALVLERIRSRAQPLTAAALAERLPGTARLRELTDRAKGLAAEAQRRERALERLYLDKCSGLVTQEQYARWSADCAAQQAALNGQARALREQAQAADRPPDPAMLEGLMHPDTLTRELAERLVERITVAPAGPDGLRDITIYWRF